MYESFRNTFMAQTATLQFWEEYWKAVGCVANGLEPSGSEPFDAAVQFPIPFGSLSFFYHRDADTPRIKDVN